MKPVPETTAFLQNTRDNLTSTLGLTASAAADDAEACTVPKITFKVIAHNKQQLNDNCAPTREVRVVYQKYISADETKLTTLSADVAFGASHEFTCADSALGNGGGSADFDVYFEAFQGGECEPIPFEQASYGAGFGSVLRDGGTLTITIVPPGDIQSTITNPPAAGTQNLEASDPQNAPTPDPEFAAER